MNSFSCSENHSLSNLYSMLLPQLESLQRLKLRLRYTNSFFLCLRNGKRETDLKD